MGNHKDAAIAAADAAIAAIDAYERGIGVGEAIANVIDAANAAARYGAIGIANDAYETAIDIANRYYYSDWHAIA